MTILDICRAGSDTGLAIKAKFNGFFEFVRYFKMTISYTPDKGPIWITLTAIKGKSVLSSIRCTSLASSGTFTVPAAVTATIPTGATHLELGAGQISLSTHSWAQLNGNTGQISFLAFHRRYTTLSLK